MSSEETTKKYDSHISHSNSVKSIVYSIIDKNTLISTRYICDIAKLDYKKYGDYIRHIKSKWKYDYQKQQGSIRCIPTHGWRGWTYLSFNKSQPIEDLKKKAVDNGWIQSRSRSHFLLWKDKLGRIQWFPSTDRLNIYIRQPATLGKAYQLICNSFSYTGLITDILILETILKGIRFKSAHYTFETKQRLPSLTIDLFSKSNGIVIKVGDRTHPTSVEVIASYPDWGERNEKVMQQFTDVLNNLLGTFNGNGINQKIRMDLDYMK